MTILRPILFLPLAILFLASNGGEAFPENRVIRLRQPHMAAISGSDYDDATIAELFPHPGDDNKVYIYIHTPLQSEN